MSKRNWSISILLGIALFSLFYSYTVISTLITVISRQLAYTAVESGAILAAFGYAYAPMQIPVGLLADKYEPRKLLTLSTFFLFLGTLFFSSSSDFVQMLASRVVMGAAGSFLFVDGLKTIEIYVEKEKRAMVLGIFESFAFAGITVSNYLAQFLLQSIGAGWRFIYLGASLIVIISCILCFVFIPKKILRSTKDMNVVAEAPAAEKATGRRGNNESWSYREKFTRILNNKQFWIQAFVSIALFGSSFAVIFWFPTYFETKGFDLSYGSATVALIGIGSIAGALVLGHFSDRANERPKIIRLSLLSYAMLVILVLVFSSPSLWVIPLLASFAIGVTQGGLIANTRIVGELFPKNWVGVPYGIYNCVSWLGSAIFPFFVGIILSLGFSFETAFIPVAILPLIMLCVTFAAAV